MQKYKIGQHVSMYVGTRKEILFGTVVNVKKNYWTPSQYEYFIVPDDRDYDKFWIDENKVIAATGKLTRIK